MNLSPGPERFGVISGRAFLHCKKETKADLNTVLQEPCRFRRLEDVRALDDLREFPTPVILDQARERAALRGKK